MLFQMGRAFFRYHMKSSMRTCSRELLSIVLSLWLSYIYSVFNKSVLNTQCDLQCKQLLNIISVYGEDSEVSSNILDNSSFSTAAFKIFTPESGALINILFHGPQFSIL